MGKASWVAVGAVFLGQVFFSTLFRDSFCIPKLLPLTFGVLALWISLAAKGPSGFDGGPRAMSVPLRFLGGAMLISTLLSIDKTVSLIGPHQAGFYGLFQFVLCVLLYYGVSYNYVGTAKITGAIVAAMISAGVLALAQHYGHGSWLTFSLQDGRAGGTLGSPIYLGAFMAFSTPLALGMSEEKGWKMALGVLGLALAAASFWVARSRGGALSAGVGILAYHIGKGRKIPKEAVLACVCAAIIGAMVFFSIPKDSDIGRIEIWRAAGRIAWQYPVFGSGPDTFGLAFRRFLGDGYVMATHNTREIQLSAHNDLLQALSTLGLFGLAAYSVLVLQVFRVVSRSKNAAILGAIVALFVQAKVNPIPLGVLAAAVAIIATVDHAEWPSEAVHLRKATGAAFACCLIAICMSRAEFFQMRGENKKAQGNVIGASFDFIRAAQSNPFDYSYTQKEIEYVNYSIRRVDPRFVPADLSFILSIAKLGVYLHPNDPEAHGWRSIALAMSGDMAEADAEASEETVLAPTFLPAYERRLQFAQMRGDSEKASQYQNTIERLLALEQGRRI